MLQEMPVMSSGSGSGGYKYVEQTFSVNAGSNTVTISGLDEVYYCAAKYSSNICIGIVEDDGVTKHYEYANANYQITDITDNVITYTAYASGTLTCYVIGN